LLTGNDLPGTELNVGSHHQIIVHRYLAGQANVGAFLGEFFVFNVVSGVHLPGHDLHRAGSTQSPTPTVKNFANMGVDAYFVLDGGFPQISPGFYLDGSSLVFKLNF
jgi:hypothetical protein